MRIVLAFVLVLSMSSVGAAQDDGPPPEYRPLVDSALEEFDAQHWAEARALFERAHAIFPNARTLRGIGMAAFELRDYVAARRALDAALSETRRALTDEQHVQVGELATRARVFVGDFAVGPAPAGSELDVDGVPTTPDGDLAASGATLPLAVGAHEVTLRAPDGRSVHAQITVHGGEHGALALAITDAPAMSVDEPPPPVAPVAPPDAGPPVWATGLTIGGSVLVCAGALLVGLGASDAATVSNAPRGTDWADLEAAYGRSTPLLISGGVAFGVGLAAALVGIIGITTSRSGSTTVGIGPGSLALRGTF